MPAEGVVDASTGDGVAPRLWRAVVVIGGMLIAWEIAVRLAAIPPFLLPSPRAVLATLVERRALLLRHAGVTLAEIVLGLTLGCAAGIAAGAALAASPAARRWLLPLVVSSQAIPVFAIAPLLVLWLGYGIASKIAMATLVIFFPVAVAAFDGLAQTPTHWIDSARIMGASRLQLLLRVRLPAALPTLASGLRVAAAVAPIGAVIGEWVGAAEGLGFVMLQANARMQTDLMFAALFVLAVTAALLFLLVDAIAVRVVHWVPRTSLRSEK
ncbi:MAG: ABC transporter permease [Acidobacteria bacterium]|nr:ABC transporter permease [Acidobacteriota bacterium]